MDYWITVLNHVQNGTDVKAQHARPIVSKAYQSSSNQIITITTMYHISQSFPNPFEFIPVQTSFNTLLININIRENESTNYK